jgi:hypothetical protein
MNNPFEEALLAGEAVFPNGKLNLNNSERRCVQLTATVAEAEERAGKTEGTEEQCLLTSLLMTECSALTAAESSLSWRLRDTCLIARHQ